MKHDEMIEVIEHHKNGGEVEYIAIGSSGWWELLPETRLFNFEDFEYRIKETPKTKTVWFWRVRCDDGSWRLSTWMYTEEEVKTKWDGALEFKRMDILGSEEVPND